MSDENMVNEDAVAQAKAERLAAMRTRQALRAHALRVWSGKMGAEKRWKGRSRVRRVKVYEGDAETLVKLARARHTTVADVVALLLTAPPTGAR